MTLSSIDWRTPNNPLRFQLFAGVDFLVSRREPNGPSHVEMQTGHHPPPLVQGRYLGVVGDAAGYAHILCEHGLVVIEGKRPGFSVRLHRRYGCGLNDVKREIANRLRSAN